MRSSHSPGPLFSARPLVLFLLLHGLAFTPVSSVSGQFVAESEVGDCQLSSREVLDQARGFLENSQIEEALVILETYIDETVQPKFLDEAYFLQAAALRITNQDDQAAIVLEQLVEEFPASLLASDARLILGELYAQLNQPDKALSILKETIALVPDPATKREAISLIREIYVQRGDDQHAIESALAEMNIVQEQEREDLRQYIQGLILDQRNETTLTQLAETYPTDFPGDLAMIRLIELHTAQGDAVMAEHHIRSFLYQFPQHPYGQTATALLQSFLAKVKTNQHIIAVVLPLSGPLKPYGSDSLKGVRLALDEAEEQWGLSSIGLLVRDSTRQKATLQEIVSQVLDEFQPIAVIGPLLSREVQGIANLADEAEVPFITPSATLGTIRQLGEFWFSTALTFSLQAKRLAQYAITQLGYWRFCILFPDSAYGRQISQLFQIEVERNAGEIIASEPYDRKKADFGAEIRKLKERDLRRYGMFTPEETGEGKIRNRYTPGFDAMFLPGSPVEVALIAAQLAFYDMNVPILGSNGWNNPDLIKWGRDSIEGGIFADGFFLQSQGSTVQDFVRRYRSRFHSDPSLFTVQSYDAMRLVLDTIRYGASSGEDVRSQLFRRHDLPTLNGLTSFGADGILARNVYMIQVTNGQFVQIN